LRSPQLFDYLVNIKKRPTCGQGHLAIQLNSQCLEASEEPRTLMVISRFHRVSCDTCGRYLDSIFQRIWIFRLKPSGRDARIRMAHSRR
jgi:hypothetical protein